MKEIIAYPLIPVEIYDRYKKIKNFSAQNAEQFWKVLIDLTKDCKSSNKEVARLASLILFDIRMMVNHPSVSADSSSAKILEKRLTAVCDGRLCDQIRKSNVDVRLLLSNESLQKLADINIQSISSNYREKGDVIFFDSQRDSSYKISVKSLLTSNKEINFGSFQYDTLVQNLAPADIVNIKERKGIDKVIDGKIYKVGKGSRALLKGLYLLLEDEGTLDAFIERFMIIFKAVFQNDIFIYIKDYDYLEFYLLTKEDFERCVKDSLCEHINDDNNVINRWEGNGIRMDRTIILKYCSKRFKIAFDELFDTSAITGKLAELQASKSKILLNIY